MTVRHDPPLVLIADDQVPTTILLERVFEHEGYQIKSVYDGVSAIKEAQDSLPDLILLDVNMPGMSGFDVLQQLRENPITEKIPTILITAMGELQDVLHGLKLGADDYLRKPFQAQELLARAQSKMKSRKLEDSLQKRTQELEALLRVSEELNQHLETDDLLEFIVFLTLDLLPGTAAAICQYDADQQSLVAHCVRHKVLEENTPQIDIERVVEYLKVSAQPDFWQFPLIDRLPFGMITPLSYGSTTSGCLIIGNDEISYDDDQLRLFSGIGRQASLALRNAELYEIQLDYAQHLEDMVSARTAELESAQQMLIRSEKLASVGRLAASIAHEINNPLFPIKINLEHMLEDIESGNRVDPEEIRYTQESVERIRRIVNRLLEFAGKRRGEDIPLQTIDLSELIESIISLNRKFFQQENISIEYVHADLPAVEGNKDQLEQVLMNLTLNAKAAMDSGGILEIVTSAQDDKVAIELRDNGHGIPEDMIDTIFEPFVSTKEDGTGLGLFISYGIIQNHNGDIQVTSNIGVGTTFTVTLPITPVQVE